MVRATNPPEQAPSAVPALAPLPMRIIIRYEGCPEHSVIFGIFECADHGLGTAFGRERCLPKLIGPVLWRALRRFASICLSVATEYEP